MRAARAEERRASPCSWSRWSVMGPRPRFLGFDKLGSRPVEYSGVGRRDRPHAIRARAVESGLAVGDRLGRSARLTAPRGRPASRLNGRCQPGGQVGIDGRASGWAGSAWLIAPIGENWVPILSFTLASAY